MVRIAVLSACILASGATSIRYERDTNLMDDCPAVGNLGCPAGMKQSSLWAVSHLQPCSDGATNVFVEDPESEALMHACGPESKGALPNSCGDVRLRGLAVDEASGYAYVATSWSISRSRLATTTNGSSGSDISGSGGGGAVDPTDNLEPLVSGFVTVRLKGFNLGHSRADVVSLTVKGVECRTVVYTNSTDLACIVGDLAPLSSPLTGSCVGVATLSGGSFAGAVPLEVALSRKHAGYQKPLVYAVSVEDHGFQPTAIALHPPSTVAVSSSSSAPTSVYQSTVSATATTTTTTTTTGRLYWFNRGSMAIESCRPDGSDLFRHGRLGRCSGLALDSAGATLYASDADAGAVVALVVGGDSSDFDGDSGGAWAASAAKLSAGEGGGGAVTLASGLASPWGLALDEPNGLLFVAESGRGNLLRLEGATAAAAAGLAAAAAAAAAAAIAQAATVAAGVETAATVTAAALPLARPLLSVSSFVQLTGIAVLPPLPTSSSSSSSSSSAAAAVPYGLDLSPRLVWAEASNHDVRAATLHGTRAAPLPSVPRPGSSAAAGSTGGQPLLWPRAVAAGRRSGRVYVAEYLGRVWSLAPPPGSPWHAASAAAESSSSSSSAAAAAHLVVDASGVAPAGAGSGAVGGQQGGHGVTAAASVRVFLAATARDAASQADKKRPSAVLRLVA